MFTRVTAWKERLRRERKRLDGRRVDRRRREGERAKLVFEPLEERALLAAVPVAGNDPWYATAVNTDLVVTTGGTTLLANDSDVDGTALAASIVDGPAHGTIISSGSNGIFTYRPTTGYSGLDSFTYKANNGSFDSNLATVSVAVGGNFGPRTNQDSNPLSSPLLSGANVLAQDLSLGESLVYNSNTSNPHPIVVVETTLLAGSAVPTTIDAQLTFNGTAGSVVSYNNTSLAAGDALRFAIAADASALATGHYDWSLSVTANFSGSSSTRTYSGSTNVVNRTASEFGNGWWLSGLDQLVASSAGALLVRGNGDTLWFAANGGSYEKAAGDTEFSTLVKNGNNTFSITTKHGIVENFSTTGLATSVVDANGNTVSFSYTDGDSDSVSDEISSITEPYGRSHSFSYTGGRVSSFTDYASHATALAYSSGKLTSVTLTDPDGASSLASPVWQYVYDGTSSLLVTRTDPLNHDIDFSYGSPSRRLTQIDYPIGSQNEQFTSIESVGLASGTGNAPYRTANPQGTYTNANGYIFKFRTDRFGGIVDYGNYVGGTSSDVTNTYRDANGRPVKVLQPDAGAGRPQTRFGYNAAGDLLRQINADNTALGWTFDTTFHQVLTATDEMGRTTTVTYNAYGNELTRTDPGGNVWTTSYTGNSHGLPTSVTTPDPDAGGGLSAYVTGFAWDSYGRLTTTTNPDSSTVVLAYDAANNVTSRTDELSHVTAFGWDALNRLVTVTGADPDGAGGASSGVTSFIYNAANLKTSETDALANTTDFSYDARLRLVSKLLPDPDGAGPLDRAEETLAYDAMGNATSVGIPEYGGTYFYTYDAYNHLLSKAGPTGASPMKEDEYTYNVLGLLTSHTNSLYQLETWEYDARGRTTRHILRPGYGYDPDGPTTSTTYNYAGQVTSETDALGNVTQFTYTTAGLLNAVIAPDPDGSGVLYSSSTTFGYDALGRQTVAVDPLGHYSFWAYDFRGNVIQETLSDPDGAGGASAPSTSYDFDAAGRLESVTNSLGFVTSFGYDNLNRKISMTLPDPDSGGALSAPTYYYGYNAVGSQTSETDPLGNVTATAFDNLQRPVTRTGADPDGAGGASSPVTTWTYGDDRQVASITDPLGHSVDFGYDVFGRRTTVTNEAGYVTTTAYTLLDQVASVTTPDPDGAGGLTASTVNYDYNDLNQLESVTDASSHVTGYTYDLAGHMLTLDDASGNSTTWAYDNVGYVTMETNELGKTRSFWHDAAGNLTRKKDRNNRVTQYAYDDLDRQTAEKWLSSSTVPSLAVATTTQGGPASEVQRVGYTISGYGGSVSGTFTLSFGGQTTSGIAYNASAATVQTALQGLSSIGSGNVAVVKSQDSYGNQEWTLTFQGSLAGANQSQVTVDKSLISVMYATVTATQATDTNGGSAVNEVQTVTLSNASDGTIRLAFMGQTTGPLAYNASASTVQTALTGLSTIGSGNASVSGSGGGPWTVTFQGALAGINVQQLQGDAASAQNGSVTRTIAYTYDAASQITAASDSDGSYAYTFDNIGRQLTVSNSGMSGVPTVVLTNVYDAASNRTKLTSTVGGTADFENDYSYDNLLRLTRIDQIGQSGGSTVAAKRLNFSYDSASRLTALQRQYKSGGSWTEAATTALSYDTIDRLTGIDHKRGGTSLFTAYAYTYDHADRITGLTSQDGTVAYTYDATSQVTQADYNYQSDENFSFDSTGNRTMSGYSVGTNNKMSSDGVYNYTYDDEGNLTRRTKISDSSYTDYAWDYRNRLTNVTNKPNQYQSATMTVDYKYDLYDRRLSKVYDADGAGGGAAVTTRFVYDAAGYHPLLQFNGSSTLLERDLWAEAVGQVASENASTNALLWGLGDNLGTIRDIVNNSGTSQNHLKYNAFGDVTSESASSVNYLFGFAQTIRDEETGFAYAWHRYEQNGRWISEDPLGFKARDVNLMRYTGNDPPGRSDPGGLTEYPTGEELRGSISSWIGPPGLNAYLRNNFGLDYGGTFSEMNIEPLIDGLGAFYSQVDDTLDKATDGDVAGAVQSTAAFGAGYAGNSMFTSPLIKGALQSYAQSLDRIAAQRGATFTPLGDLIVTYIVLEGLRIPVTAGVRTVNSAPVAGAVDAADVGAANVRLPQDIGVNATPPEQLPLGRSIGKSATQNAALQADIAEAQANGATNFRVNQQQVNAAGERVGINRPDLQYTDIFGRRIYIEYDTTSSTRGPIHSGRTLANDPNGTVFLRTTN